MKDNVIYAKTINCGKCDAMDRFRKDCTAIIELELRVKHSHYEDKNFIEFSACGEIYHTVTRCMYCGGQCIDTIAELIPTKRSNASVKYGSVIISTGFTQDVNTKGILSMNQINISEKYVLYADIVLVQHGDAKNSQPKSSKK